MSQLFPKSILPVGFVAVVVRLVVVVLDVVVVVIFLSMELVVGDGKSRRHTDRSKIKRTPAAKETKMIFLCFRKRSDNEGGVSLELMMESYQGNLPIHTENENSTYRDIVLLSTLEIHNCCSLCCHAGCSCSFPAEVAKDQQVAQIN